MSEIYGVLYGLPKSKDKTVGVARQQLHFLCGDKENEAKESSLLAEGYVLHANTATSIRNSSPSNAYASPEVDEAL